MQEGKWFSEEASQIEERRESKSKGERERYTQLNAEFQRIARRDKKEFFNAKNLKNTTERVRLEISSRKPETSKEHYIKR